MTMSSQIPDRIIVSSGPDDSGTWSSDEIPTPTEGSTPPSSIGSPLAEKAHSLPIQSTHLPNPFYPPSLGKHWVAPRQLPSTLSLPQVPKEGACEDIDSPDVGTPDAWVPRDPRLVRLTGKHPFNAEAKLQDLYAQGFLTPSNLFFVRNHGAVPKIDQKMAEAWTLRIHGLCSNPTSFGLSDLVERFKVVTLPVTLVCAGNRRKEQNVVQKSLGFSWGAAGLSTALFTGVYLADVLDYIKPAKKARHIIFEGIDDLPNGPYGTSQLLSWARDKRKGMLLAWAMNGVPLEPDHGFPLRLVVPSQIGGRSVKWLARIEVSEKESQHHLHFHDNKVPPMPLGPDQARAEDHWWYDPRYIIRDLNVNSAIACPDHDEILDVSPAATDKTYTVKGYAYAGGGRRVTRVEVSSDDGHTWSLARIDYPEDLFREVAYLDSTYGELDLTDSDTCFCWCFWTFEMPISSMMSSRAIMVRCMDESLALQPRNMYWNATGMMNNWWFRVCIHHLKDGKIRFEHPTMAGTQPGGWMQRLKDEGLDPSEPNFSLTPHSSYSATIPNRPKAQEQEELMIKPDVTRKISVAELGSPEAKEDAWFVVRGEVYRGRGFFDEHPGGAHSIMLVAGEDATEDFMAIHSSDAKKQLADYHIGTLDGDNIPMVNPGRVEDASGAFLQVKTWKKATLISVKDVSSNAKVFRFGLENEEKVLGLPFGQHVYVRLRQKVVNKSGEYVPEGELVQRAYTPVSDQNTKGFIDMLIKIYHPCPEFPEGGRMTLEFAQLLPGDNVEVKGPIGHFIWKGNGIASLHGEDITVREIGLVCGGSGITPTLQLLRAILGDSSDSETKVWVLDFNRHSEDILCRDELERLASAHKGRFHLHYSLTGTPIPENWSYSIGRVTKEMLDIHLPKPGAHKLVCICGPTLMEQSAKELLAQVGWDPSRQVVLF